MSGHLCPTPQCAASHSQWPLLPTFPFAGPLYPYVSRAFDPPMWTVTYAPRRGIARKRLVDRPVTTRRGQNVATTSAPDAPTVRS